MMQNVEEGEGGPGGYAAGETSDGAPPSTPTSQKSSFVSEADLPVEGSQRILTTETGNGRSKRRLWIIAIIVIIVLLATVIGLSVGLSQRTRSASQNPIQGGPAPTPTKPPVSGPALPPADEADVKNFLSSAGVARSAMDDSDSAHGQALQFLESTGIPVPNTAFSDEGYKYLSTYVLSLLFFSMGGEGWDDDFFFASTPNVCDWTKQKLYTGIFAEIRQEGVICSAGEIIAIELPLNKLAGPLPSELGLMTRLQVLGMAQNQINGNIPEEIGNMSELVIISFENNFLEGSIPASLGNLNKLSTFAVSQNTMDGPIPDSFSGLTALVGIGLDDNNFDGVVAPLGSLPNIKLVYLEDNAFEETVDDSFLVDAFDTLVHLDLSDNKFKGSLPAHFFDGESLLVLDVHGNELTGPLPEFSQNVKLNFLALHENGFAGPIPNTISNLQGLQHLDLTSNALTEFAPGMSDMVTLEYLFLADNDFVAGPIPDFIRDLTQLRDLSLKDTQRTGEIPTWFGELDNMLYLDLDSNQLGGNIPSEIGDMVSMVFLQLQRNDLVGEIPASFGSLTNFQYIDIENNTLTGNMDVICAIKNSPDSWLVADCGGATPEIECSCCTTCCEDVNSESCNELDMLGQLDPIWENGYNRYGLYTFQDFNITGDNDGGAA